MGRRATGPSLGASSGAAAAAAALDAAAPTTPTTSILEMHVRMLTTKLVHAEGRVTQAEAQSEALRDQMQTMQFEKSMEVRAHLFLSVTG